MRLRRTSTAAAVAALGSLAVLGTAHVASADTGSTGTAAKPSSCPATASLTGLAGAKIIVGGAPVKGHVTFANVSGKPIPQILEALLFGPISANNASTSLVVQAKKSNGTWVTLPYTAALHGIVIRDQQTWPANGLDSFDLRISAPVGTPTGLYVGVALDGSTSGLSGHITKTPPTSFQGCMDGGYTSLETFSVVKSGTNPTPSPTKSAPAPVSSETGTPAPASTATGKALATTGGGSDSGMIAGAAGALVVAGGAGVLVARRRKAAHN
jgi:hypothetical protein